MTNPAPPPIAYGVTHYSDRFPVVRTACGTLGKSTGEWRYVDCFRCLEKAPGDESAVRKRGLQARKK